MEQSSGESLRLSNALSIISFCSTWGVVMKLKWTSKYDSYIIPSHVKFLLSPPTVRRASSSPTTIEKDES